MILMNDFKADPTELREYMLNAVQRVLDSGWYVLGKEVAKFEQQWATLCGVAHGVGVGNGMDAIEITLRSLDIGVGDEVITTPMTAFATVLAILRTGATPVLADIEANTALLSLASVERCLSPRTKAIVLVHLYGQVRDMDCWQSFCNQYRIHLIEDCAQAHLSTWQKKVAGSFGVAGAYSFYPTKNLGAIGDAGMLVTNDDTISQRAAMLRNYGQSVRYYHPEVGLNSRLDEIQAAMLIERLKWLVEYNQRRQQIALAYQSNISNPLVKLLSPPQEACAHVYHLYVVTTLYRDKLMAYLSAHDVQTLIHYPIPVHHQEASKQIRHDPNGLKVSEIHAGQCLSIPCHPHMTNVEITKVIDVINNFRV
jgi:dTDP-4-amino-4,6-dideoxygalactose transaminase